MTQPLSNLLRPFVWPAISLLAALFTSNAAFGVESPRERLSFNVDWRFAKGDPAGVSNQLSYAAIRDRVVQTGTELAGDFSPPPPAGSVGADVSYLQPDFDDSNWRKLDLPHDWGIEGPFKQEYAGKTGKLPWWGVGWYRKHFQLPASDEGRKIYLDIDGAMSYAAVWLNGQFVGGWPYGYASWQVDLTPFVKFGADNVIAIRLDNPPDSSRWYPGGGIYRNVWLEKTSPVHVTHWGTYVTTPEVSENKAAVKIQIAVENDANADTWAVIQNRIYLLGVGGAREGQAEVLATVGSNPRPVSNIPANRTITEWQQITIASPKLWNLEKPDRYVVVTTISRDGKLLDQYETPFGIRTIQFTTTNGFLLNGRRVRLKGVCDHHDLGALGAAVNERALQRQIEMLQEMGGNAIRCSHNPPAPELLDLCDKMGMLVMDEAFDCWKRGKTPNDYHLLWDDWHEKDWRAELRRDRNHPSIILWSIGNEVPEQGHPDEHAIAAELTRVAHEEDATRPTTAACNNAAAGFNGFQTNVDVFGYNYKPRVYAKFRETNPTEPLFGSETASCVSSRGEYFFPIATDKSGGRADFQVSSYDLYGPGWSTKPDVEFEAQEKNAFVAGEFVWTGFDYLGEPTPYNSDASNLLNFTDPAEQERMKNEMATLGRIAVPSRSSYFGIIDLAGFKKDRFYLYQAHWRPDLPMAHILPHWNWPGRPGQTTPVYVYTSGDSAELFLNGKSLGIKKRSPLEYRLQWDDVVYEPGELRVIVGKDGRKWAEDIVKTTGPAAQLKLEADRNIIAADGSDVCFVTLRVIDRDGLTVPRSNNRIHFKVSSPGELIATDNGDPTCLESFQSPDRNAFNGLAIAIVRARRGHPGKIQITAESDSLSAGQLSISAR